jgi:hypothetical protein
MTARQASALVLWLGLIGTGPMPAATLVLTDGSRLQGEVVGFSDGVYRIRSPVLGTISLDASRVRAIEQAGEGAPAVAPAAPPLDVQGVQQALLGDPALLARIQALQQDPELQAVLRDPALLRAIAAGDTGALLDSEAFLRLLRHPGIREITEQARGLLSATPP